MMKISGIQAKLVFSLLALMVAASLITSFFFFSRVRAGLLKETDKHVRSLAQTSALMIEGDAFLNVLQGSDPTGFLDRTIRRKMREIYTASPNVRDIIAVGRIQGAMKVAVSIPDIDMTPQDMVSEAVAPIAEALKGMVTTDLRGLAADDRITYGYAPIFNSEGKPVGALRIGYSTAAMGRVLDSLRVRALTAFLICVVMSLIVSYFTARHLVAPIMKLAEATSRVADGELGLKVHIDSRDELGDLARSFSLMSDKLKQAYDKLQNKLGLTDQELVKTNRELAEANTRLQTAMEELKRNQERLVQSEKLAALGEMAACVAHEVRNPLSVIRSSAQLLTGKEPDKASEGKASEGKSAELIQFIQEEVTRLDRVVENFLKFSRPVKVTLADENFNEVVEYATRVIEEKARETNVTLAMNLTENPGHCELDREQFRQLLMNLILNAIDASPNGGTVTVSTSIDDRWGVVSVTDEGSGISREHQEHLFKPFFTTKREGTGLGLSISQHIARAHGGELTLMKTSDQGTSLMVRIPRKGELQASGADSRS